MLLLFYAALEQELSEARVVAEASKLVKDIELNDDVSGYENEDEITDSTQGKVCDLQCQVCVTHQYQVFVRVHRCNLYS